MAQKKKASAARSASANVPVPPSQEVSAPLRSPSSAPSDGDSRQAGEVPGSQAGSVVEVPLSENGGGAQRRKDALGKGDVTEKASGKEAARGGVHLSGNGKARVIHGPGGSTVTSAGKYESANAALIRGECEKALVALRRGNSTKAVRLIKDACSRNEASGVAYRVQGHIFMRLAAVIEDTNTKQRHFASALESARKAASFAPQSVEYAHFYAQLLFEAAKDSEGYGEVVRECERALLIDDPVDPARESLHNEQQPELPTAEARIAHVYQELRALVQKANISSISTWMKTLGTGAGEEKLRFVQMRKFADQDPMEQRVSQPKRPHEVKKVVKTPEERRKEVEVRVAAARLLQQRDASAEGAADTPDDHEKSIQKKLDRRKSSGPNSRRLSKPLSIDERIDPVRQFWHALTQENRETKLVIAIADLKDHLASWKEVGGLIKSHAASDALSEALEFAQEKKTWRFWACCKCGERFITYPDLSHHTWEEHIRSLPEKLQQVVPQEINQDWVDQLLDEDCRPIDGAAAVKMLIESARSFLSGEAQVVESVTAESENSSPSQKVEDEDIMAKSVQDDNQKTIEKDVEDIEAGFGHAFSGVDEGHLLMCKGDCQNGMKVGKEIPSQDLPSADDETRRKLLEKIYSLFRILIKSKYLAQEHVAKIILYAIEEIQSLVPDPAVHYEFNHSPLYIRFLDPQPLQQIQKYLMELAQTCGVSFQLESPIQPSVEEGGDEEIIQDRLFLNEDFTQLLLDELVVKEFPEELRSPRETWSMEHGGAEEIVAEKGSAAHRPPLPLMKGKDGETLPKHVDLQLSWIFGTTEYELQPSGWKHFREEQGQRGRDVYRALEKEFQHLYTLCDKKYELVSYEEALNLVERLCGEENRRRERNDGPGKRFETVLRDRQQELLDARIRGLSSAQNVELEAIRNVLRDAQTGMVRRHPYDGTLGVRISDSDEDEEEAWRMQESMSRADTRVEAVILRQREQLSNEVNHLDAKIMKATDDLQKMEIKLGQLAVLDYRAVVLPLVKCLLQSRLEGEAEKDAMQKSDAAQEAFLAELAKDQKNSGSKEAENLKQVREKSKDKKKTKEQKKSKDAKRGPSNSEQQRDPASGGLDEVDDVDNWDWVLEDDLRQQRESEILHQTLLWEEERKLLEALESQRRVEEEAKQRHLSEQERKKELARQIVEPLEDGEATGTLSTASTTVDVSLEIPTSPIQLLLVQNECQDPTEMAGSWNDQASLPLDHTNDSLLVQIEGSVSEQFSVDFSRCAESTLRISEQQPMKDACHSTFEAVGCVEDMSLAGKEALILGDGDHLNALQKKTRGSGNRNRRKRGPRIYAEEGIIADQDAQPWKTSEIANDSRTSLQQNASKDTGRLSTVDKPNPLLRQNASRSFGTAPANGVPAVQPLLLLPAPPAFEGAGGHEGKKTLRQLQVEQDDEEQFQADLEQAMRQSLDMLTSQPRAPIATSSVAAFPSNTVSSSGAPGDLKAQQLVESGIVGSPTAAAETPLIGVEEVGKGLRNEIGQYNCFLNVVIQSLWHLRRFREELLSNSSMQHAHVGNPCVVCALRDIFLGLDTPAHNSSGRDAVAPTALRVALSALYSDSDFFQEAQMNDASEVLAVVFECLHKAFVPNSSSDGDSESSSAGGSWDCQGPHPCMAHALFGLDVAEQMNCQHCGIESRHLKYTTFFHNINASALRTAKVLYQDSSMDELLKVVDMNHQLACDTETGGCGRQNHIHHLLHAAPSVFTTVLGWQNGRESFEDISATVDAMDVELDVGVIYRGLDEGFQHRLVSVVCYYGQHYHCFAYNQELGRWVMFDDSTVKIIGEWRDVASTCRRGHLQPQVLFYEAVAARSEALTLAAVWPEQSSSN